jgi:bacillithiol biosynthesis cysteine-adding enzyme BshC
MTPSMECHCLGFRDLPQTTKLFAAFLDNFSKVSRFYAHPPDESGVAAAAREVRLSADMRGAVVEILREQNRRFGSDAATWKNLDRLAGGAVAVVTGQQVGLFSGPAFSFYKALTAVRWAKELTRRGTEAVPVFWLATEDHDLAEINHTFWIGREGLARIEIARGDEFAGHRVGEIPLGEGVVAALEAAAATLGGGFAEIAEALHASYGPGEFFGSAFGKLFARLLGGRGMILLDPLDARLHRLASGVYRRAIEETPQIAEDLLARNKILERAGFHAQVKVTGQTTLLFRNIEGRREPLRRRNGGFMAGGKIFAMKEISEALGRFPEEFSPNVLLRPVVQDTLLPTVAYVGGPAEVAYFAQAEVVYRRLLGRMPAILPRASITLVTPVVARTLKRYGATVDDVFRGRQSLRRMMELRFLPRGLARRFADGEKTLRCVLKNLRRPLARLDKTLLGSLDTAERKMLHQFLKLKGKVGRAENFRTGLLDRDESLLLNYLFPHRGLQERTLCLLPFLAIQGPELLEEIEKRSGPGCGQHQMLFL